MRRYLGVLVLFGLIFLFGAALAIGAVSKYNDQRSGTAGKAHVSGCTGHTGRYAGGSFQCTGTWTIGGSLLDGGHVAYGRIEGAGRSDIGQTIDVRIHGSDHATKPALATPIVLMVLGIFLLAVGAFVLVRTWRASVRARHAT